jgi:hypothetical protein
VKFSSPAGVDLQRGENSYVKIVIAVIEGQRHAPRRQPRFVERRERLAKAEDGIAATLEGGEPRFERFRRHVEPRIPLVLVFEGNPVVGENQQPVLPPSAVAYHLEYACPMCRGQDGRFCCS